MDYVQVNGCLCSRNDIEPAHDPRVLVFSTPLGRCVGTFVARVLCFGRYLGHGRGDGLHSNGEVGRWTCVRRDTLHEGFVGFHRQDSLDLVGEESLRNVRHAMSYSNYFK